MEDIFERWFDGETDVDPRDTYDVGWDTNSFFEAAIALGLHDERAILRTIELTRRCAELAREEELLFNDVAQAVLSAGVQMRRRERAQWWLWLTFSDVIQPVRYASQKILKGVYRVRASAAATVLSFVRPIWQDFLSWSKGSHGGWFRVIAAVRRTVSRGKEGPKK